MYYGREILQVIIKIQISSQKLLFDETSKSENSEVKLASKGWKWLLEEKNAYWKESGSFLKKKTP